MLRLLSQLCIWILYAINGPKLGTVAPALNLIILTSFLLAHGLSLVFLCLLLTTKFQRNLVDFINFVPFETKNTVCFKRSRLATLLWISFHSSVGLISMTIIGTFKSFTTDVYTDSANTWFRFVCGIRNPNVSVSEAQRMFDGFNKWKIVAGFTLKLADVDSGLIIMSAMIFMLAIVSIVQQTALELWQRLEYSTDMHKLHNNQLVCTSMCIIYLKKICPRFTCASYNKDN